jgi:transposase
MIYSVEFRREVVSRVRAGESQKEVAEKFHIAVGTVSKWCRRDRAGLDLKDSPPKRSFKKIDPVKLKTYVAENPDDYLSEIAKEFGCCNSAIHKALCRLEITRKKRPKSMRNRIRKR